MNEKKKSCDARKSTSPSAAEMLLERLVLERDQARWKRQAQESPREVVYLNTPRSPAEKYPWVRVVSTRLLEMGKTWAGLRKVLGPNLYPSCHYKNGWRLFPTMPRLLKMSPTEFSAWIGREDISCQQRRTAAIAERVAATQRRRTLQGERPATGGEGQQGG